MTEQKHRPVAAARGNGGFPLPAPGEPSRSLRSIHPECGEPTRIELPESLPESVIRRVRCDACGETYEPVVVPDHPGALERAATVGGRLGRPVAALRRRARSLLARAPGPGWAIFSIPVAILAVVLGLSLIQGSGPAATPPAADQTAAAEPGAAPEARLIKRPGFTLALPPRWRRVEAPGAASFAARSRDETADATLWIQRDPDLSFREFEAQSLAQIGEIADNPRVVSRSDGPTRETRIVEMRGDVDLGNGLTTPYRVTIRQAGSFSYYLASSFTADAPPSAYADVERLHTSFLPDVDVAAGGRG